MTREEYEYIVGRMEIESMIFALSEDGGFAATILQHVLERLKETGGKAECWHDAVKDPPKTTGYYIGWNDKTQEVGDVYFGESVGRSEYVWSSFLDDGVCPLITHWMPYPKGPKGASR